MRSPPQGHRAFGYVKPEAGRAFEASAPASLNNYNFTTALLTEFSKNMRRDDGPAQSKHGHKTPEFALPDCDGTTGNAVRGRQTPRIRHTPPPSTEVKLAACPPDGPARIAKRVASLRIRA